MKILKLKIKNINSLVGENEIDFNSPIFTREGLFAITGKTGAGKTSILDAISLAFYGKTARLGLITANENDIMTRGEMDCYAEVTFEVAGKLWKSSWSQARNKSGNLNQVKRLIADDTGKIFADSITSCNNQIIQILGLNFEQFTKVIMLAQGSFAAFLNADKNEKGALLEQITGTEIYADISKKVFEQNRLERERLERILIELNSISVLSEDQISQLSEEIKDLEIKRGQANTRLQNLVAAKKWLAEIAKLEMQISQAKQSLPALEAQVSSNQEKSDNAESALKRIIDERTQLEPVFNQAKELDTRISEKTKLLEPTLLEIGEIHDELDHASKALEEKKSELKNFQTSLLEKQHWAKDNVKYEQLIMDYSVIQKQYNDLQIEQNKLEKISSRIKVLSEELTQDKARQEGAVTAFAEAEKNVTAKTTELSQKRIQLLEILGGKEIVDLHSEKEKLNSLNIQIKRLIEIENAISGNNDQIELFQKKIEKYTQSILEYSKQKEQEIKSRSEVEKHIFLIEENIKLTRTIQSLEELRGNLQDGAECPLCGSLHHPFASGNIPEASAKEKELEVLKAQLQQIISRLQEVEITLAQSESDKNNASENKIREEYTLSDNLTIRNKIKTELNTLDSNFSISEADDKINALEKIHQLHAEKIDGLDSVIKAASILSTEIRQLQENELPFASQQLTSAEKLKNEIATHLQMMEYDMNQQSVLRNELTTSFDLAQGEFTAKLTYYAVEDIITLQNCLDKWRDNTAQIAELTNKINSLLLVTSKEETACDALKNSLEEKQNVANTLKGDIQQLRTARSAIFSGESVENEENHWRNLQESTQAERDEALAKLNQVKTEFESQKAVIQTQEKNLSDTVELQLIDKNIDEIEEELAETQNLSQQISQQIGAKTLELVQDEENKRKNSQKLIEKEKQQAVCNNWASLNSLIGSQDGNRFRNFAQALTFEHLISLSNKQLQKMSDRYVLKRTGDTSNPFDLMVIDKFQDCEVRTAKNLSGGEKFIVSLSLALGLASMASKNMQIDTMFIDEGFGTLDSEYLDVALNTLSNLQSEGKIIGVISHLSELKDRIANHIEIIPGGNGFSRIKTMSGGEISVNL
jgi:exonuclease SbcC